MILNPNPRPDGTVPVVDHNPPKLNPEIVQWFESRRKRLDVRRTTRTPSGQTLDWIPIESQTKDGVIAKPPPRRPVSHDEKVHPVSFELENPRVERGPAGTVPVLRKNLSALHETTSLKDYLSKRGGAHLNKKHPNKGPSDPGTTTFFHAQSAQSVELFGCGTWLNVWTPYVEDSTGHSIMQLGMQNYDNPLLESLEAGWTVDHSLNGDWAPHLFVYYTNNGYTQDGDNQGGYNQDVDGWVQVNGTYYPGAPVAGTSTTGGTQVGFEIGYLLFENNWWFWLGASGTQGEWIGYYPCSVFYGSEFDSFVTLGARAQWVSFWGEVASTLSDPTKSTTQMGSGKKAKDGWGKACFQKNLIIKPDAGDNSGFVNQSGSYLAEDPSKYDAKLFENSGGGWGSYFYAGG
jgi:hypothetical protein